LSVPCGCVYEDNRRYKCENCPYFCLERREIESGRDLTFYISEGLDLEELTISQKIPSLPPIFVPLGTRNARSSLPLAWVALEMEKLVVVKKDLENVARLKNQSDFDNYFRLPSITNLIAVFNGQDKLLETFWSMPHRQKLFRILKERGVLFATGPTFSITDESGGFPASHNVLMQRRHNRIIKEISDSGIIPIPNVYSRDEKGIDDWANWINKNEIQLISRDFSLTKSGRPLEKEISKLISLLLKIKSLGRKIHVILLGLGTKNSENVLRKVNKLGFTATIVSKDPVLTAINGGRLTSNKLGRISKSKDHKTQKSKLILHNIQFFTNYLSGIAKS
jgi:hypothetical protein